MGNLFSEQIRERELSDEVLKQSADRQITDSVTRSGSADVFYGVHTNEEALQRILGLCGIDGKQLANLESEDVLFTRVEGEKDWFRRQTGYCIAQDEDGSYTALLPGYFGGYYRIGENGKKQKINEKNSGGFRKVYCLCRLLPEDDLSITGLLGHLFSYMRRKAQILYMAIAVLAALLGLVFPRMTSTLLSSAGGAGAESWSAILPMAAVCFCSEIIRLLINLLLSAFDARFTAMATYNIKNAVLIRYLSDADRRLDRRSASEIKAAIDETLPEFVRKLMSSGLNLIPHLLFTICYCLMSIYYLRETSVPMFVILAGLSVAMWYINKGFNFWYSRIIRHRVRGNHMLFQTFKGIEKIRSRSAQKRVYAQWAGVFAEETFSDKQRKKYVAMSSAVQDFVTPFLTVVLISAVISSDLTQSNLLTGTLLAGLLAAQVPDIILYVNNIFDSKSLWQSISFLFEGRGERVKKVKCRNFSPRLSVEKVSFAYPGMEKLLDNVSLEVKEGEYVGIVGMSGCGKSTLLKLILGILSPDRGEISYGGMDLASTEHKSILKHIGIILQGETLVPGTIRQNMMMQPKPVSEEKIWETLEKVGIADLIRSYPNGLDTEIGMTGAAMSGGQMQKLLIARAIVSDPKMIVFDEATSALDNVSQRDVKNALDAMRCTRIVVAHRLSTVRDCDRILLLDNGKITQEGTYDELVNQEGLFRDLVLCQNAAQPA